MWTITNFSILLNAFHLKQSCEKLAMTKTQLKSVLSLAQGHRERELIRYTAGAAAGLSASGARKHYGFDGFNKRVELVENALKQFMLPLNQLLMSKKQLLCLSLE